jgi:FkbM family methyltransferase
MLVPDIEVHAEQTYGQCAEDVIVCGLIRALSFRQDKIWGRRYLEIGANHPVSCSATYLMHKQFGMTGVLVEANPELVPALQRFRPADTIVAAAVVPQPADFVDLHISKQNELSSIDKNFVETWHDPKGHIRKTVTVPALTLNQILEKHFGKSSPSLLSIDVEGLDFALLKTIDWRRWRPSIIQIEPSENYAPGTTTAMMDALAQQGYAAVAITPVNLIAVDTTPLMANVRRFKKRRKNIFRRILGY